MAITFNPSSLTMRVGFRQTVVVTSTTPITSIAAVDARIITVSGATGPTNASVVITPINGSYGVGKLRIGNSGGELVDMNITVLGIDTTFVAGMIGIASSDIGTLCRGLAGTVQKINKWSKWKPIRYASIAPLTDTILKNQNYGLTTPSMGYDAIKDYALGSVIDYDDLSTQKKWEYLNPTGGASQPFRLDDFRGYDGGSVSMFDPQKNANPNVYADGYGLLKMELDISNDIMQAAGGLVPNDFIQGPNWHLGVMLIDYEADGFPTKILAIDTATIDITQSLTIDITALPSSTYIACFFLQYSINGGFSGQLNNPTYAQITALDDVDNWIAIEDGMVAFGLQTFYDFNMWSISYDPDTHFGGPTSLAASDYYDYYPGVNVPHVGSTYHEVYFSTTSQSFSIEPKPAFDPPYTIMWRLDTRIWMTEPVWWTDNAWRVLFSWFDADGDTVGLCLKTVSNVICLALVNLTNDSLIGSAVNTGKAMPTAMEDAVRLRVSSHAYNDVRALSVFVDGYDYEHQRLSDSVANAQSSNGGPAIKVGYYYATTYGYAPRGLAMNYISLWAYGRSGY